MSAAEVAEGGAVRLGEVPDGAPPREDEYAVLTAAEVAAWLRVSRPHVGELARRGVLHPIRNVGNRLLFSRRSVRLFIESNGEAS